VSRIGSISLEATSMSHSTSRSRALPIAGAVAAVLAGAAVLQVAVPPQGSAWAQDQAVTAEVRAPSFADVVERASPAVVNISVSKVQRAAATAVPRDFRQRGTPGSPLDEFFGRFFEMPAVPSAPRRSAGAGSGFIIDAEGYIVTNHHVVSDAERIVVTLSDGRQLDAEVVGEDPQMDLALLAVSVDGRLPFVAFADSDAVRVGEWVITIGNPFGLGGTATAGIVSARGRDIRSGPYDDYLQVDASINRGNSGGPVFNAEGEVIGVSTAIFSPNGGNVGIGFAIPSNRASAVIAQLKESGTVERGWLGVQLQSLDAELAESLGLDDARGALVAEVVGGSPAAEAGLEPGDVVTRFGDRDIGSVRDLTFAVAERRPGERVQAAVVRGGAEQRLDVELGDRSDARPIGSRAPARTGERGASAALGIRLAPLTDQDRARLGLSSDASGVRVVDVLPDSRAAGKLRPDDVVVSVNRQSVRSVDEVTAALRADARALLLVRRGDGQLFVTL
jgi:serine protease Do